MVRHHRGQGVPGRLGIIEVALRVGLQAHRELVEVLGHLVIVVEALVEVDLTVAIEVVEHGKLVAACDMDPAIDMPDAQGLEHSRGDAPPLELGLILPRDPDIPIPGAKRDPSVGQEIKAGEACLRQPRVRLRRGERLLRISVSHWSTTEADVDRSVDALVAARAAVLAPRGA